MKRRRGPGDLAAGEPAPKRRTFAEKMLGATFLSTHVRGEAQVVKRHVRERTCTPHTYTICSIPPLCMKLVFTLPDAF